MRAACEAVLLGLLLPPLLVLACTTPPNGTPASPPAAASPPSPRPGLTANFDARGAGSQPDYEGEARALRDQILPRLPTPAPTDRRAACTAMLDAAVAFYRDVERDEPARERLLADLQTTRPADQSRCEQDTSPRAATCVTLRLADRDAEFPWLLDQCSRAFPD